MRRGLLVLSLIFSLLVFFPQIADAGKRKEATYSEEGLQSKIDAGKSFNEKEVRWLMGQMKKEYRKWIEEEWIDLVISDDEMLVFVKIKEPYQFYEFQKKFWERRSFNELGFRISFKEEFASRVRFAKDYFGSPNDDRARTFVLVGPPAGRGSVKCPGLYPIELWAYPMGIPKITSQETTLVFYCDKMGGCRGSGTWKLWIPTDGYSRLVDFLDASVSTSDLRSRSASFGEDLVLSCMDGDSILRGLASTKIALGNYGERSNTLFLRPPADLEGVENVLTHRTIPDPRAEPLSIRIEEEYLVQFSRGSGHQVQTTLNFAVSTKNLKTRLLGGEEVYNLDATLVVLRDSDSGIHAAGTWQFNPGKKEVGEEIFVSIPTKLRPGEYQFRILFSDKSRGGADLPGEAGWQRTLVVPGIPVDSVGEEEVSVIAKDTTPSSPLSSSTPATALPVMLWDKPPLGSLVGAVRLR